MKPFIISYEEQIPVGTTGRDSSQYVFLVNKGELRFPVSIEVSGSTEKAIENEIGAGELSQMLPKIGLEYVLRKLEAKDYPEESTLEYQNIPLNLEQIRSGLEKFSKKYCQHQGLSDTGPICKVSPENDPYNKKVSQFTCNECTLSDSRVVCSHLVHPEVVSEANDQRGMFKVGNLTYLNCEKRSEPNPAYGNNCIPGGSLCWERFYEPEVYQEDLPSDLPERVADEIDFLNLAFKIIHQDVRENVVPSDASRPRECAAEPGWSPSLRAGRTSQ